MPSASSVTYEMGAFKEVETSATPSERFQVFDQVLLLFVAELQAEHGLVVVNDIVQVLEATVVIKAALRMGEKGPKGRRTIAPIRRTARLEIVNPDLLSRVHAPPRLCEERWHVASRAPAGAIEHLFPALGRFGIEASIFRLRRRHSQLVEVEGGELRRDQIIFGLPVAELGLGGDRELFLVVQPRIEEGSLPVHLQVRDEGVPVGDRAPAGLTPASP